MQSSVIGSKLLTPELIRKKKEKKENTFAKEMCYAILNLGSSYRSHGTKPGENLFYEGIFYGK